MVSTLFTVKVVTGTNVTFTDVDTQADGTSATETLWVDISTGPHIPSSGEYFVVSPGKPVGESVYPGDYHYAQLPIQDVKTVQYASANRQVAHVQARNQTTVNPTPTSPYTTEDYSWDQASGMFTEILKKTSQGSTLLHIVLDSTNIWQADSPFGVFVASSAILTIMSAGLIGIVVFGAFAARRRKKRS